MIEIVMSLVAVVLLAGIIAVISLGHPREMRPWLGLALGEYLVCSTAQLIYSQLIVHGGDEMIYRESGARISRLLDDQFGFAAPEVLRLLFQQPSIFDQVIYGGGSSNTGSMHAICAVMIFLFRGSEIGAHFFVSGLALCGTIAIYTACQDAFPEVPKKRMLIATVLFPSVPFWTCAFHKECFGVIGIGVVLAGWRCVYRGRLLRAILYLPFGVLLIYLFRAPVLGPLLLGLAVYVVAERMQKTRGAGVSLVGPAYFVLGLGVLAVVMLALARVDPSLGVDKLGESVSSKQEGWSAAGTGLGGSDFGGEAPQTLGGQVLRVPLAIINALLRPQLFDVHNFGALISATEMSAVTWIIGRGIRRQGVTGMLDSIQRSPFLLMCAVVTFVGCTLVGLVTLNFGSLARYRVPFLPFYGALLTGLIDLPVLVRKPKRERVTSRALRLALGRSRPVIPEREPD